MAQQQQQALHATGGNMYMGGGGMAAIGGMHQMHQRLGYPRTNNQRPPNVSVGPPDGLGNSIAGRGAQQEWRHLLMQQQGFQAQQMRAQFNQQGHQSEYRRVILLCCCRVSCSTADVIAQCLSQINFL